jgi:hypothetical protein
LPIAPATMARVRCDSTLLASVALVDDMAEPLWRFPGCGGALRTIPPLPPFVPRQC